MNIIKYTTPIILSITSGYVLYKKINTKKIDDIENIVSIHKIQLNDNVKPILELIHSDLMYIIDEYVEEDDMKEMCFYGLRDSKCIRSLIGYSIVHKYKNDIEQQDRILLCIPELIHNASLILDDIMDNDNMRRNKKSFFTQYSTSKAHLISFLLHNISLKILMKLKVDETDVKELLETLLENEHSLIFGQYLDLSNSNDVSLIEYENIVSKKTSSLFEFTFFIIAYLLNIQNNALKHIGYHFGILFQIYDDFTDYYRDKKTNALNIICLFTKDTAYDRYQFHLQQTQNILVEYNIETSEITQILNYMTTIVTNIYTII